MKWKIILLRTPWKILWKNKFHTNFIEIWETAENQMIRKIASIYTSRLEAFFAIYRLFLIHNTSWLSQLCNKYLCRQLILFSEWKNDRDFTINKIIGLNFSGFWNCKEINRILLPLQIKFLYNTQILIKPTLCCAAPNTLGFFELRSFKFQPHKVVALRNYQFFRILIMTKSLF